MSAKRHERSSARAHAVQVLYTSDIQGKSPSQLLDEGLCLVEDGTLSDYALGLIRGVQECGKELDAQVEEASVNWTLARMPIVDRAILRLAVYEMLHQDDVPVSVTINEAVELAKTFGGEEDSPRFVNGVLGRIARSLDPSHVISNEGDEPFPHVIPSEGDEASSHVVLCEGDESKDLSEPVGALVGASGAAAVVQRGV